MKLDTEACFHALRTKDKRFDGMFYVAVSTTGIYCRPVCSAKAPLRTNCTFFAHAAAAERAGYRPCLRCRPELAPGNSQVDSTSRIATKAASRIEDGALVDRSLGDLAAEIGVTDRHLRRVLEHEYGVSPIELAQTHRLLLAKRLLTDTRLSMTEVAYASGFSSLRRFNALFKQRYRLNPTEIRRTGGRSGAREALVCELGFAAPLDWESLLGFLNARLYRGVESIIEDRYRRTVKIGPHRGWLEAFPSGEKQAITVRMSASLAPVFRDVVARVKRLFDLSARPDAIAETLGELAEASPGLRVPGAFDGYEIGIRAILGQQVSVKGASTLAARFAAAFGAPIETPFEELTHLTPTPQAVLECADEQITALGITSARARAIKALSGAVACGDILMEPGPNIEETMKRLIQLPGIGEWTVQYLSMRTLGWPDAFPHTDLGIVKALGETDGSKILEIAELWRPWRSYAAMHLWKRLEKMN